MERLTYWCEDGRGVGKWFVAIDSEGGEDYGPHIDRLAAYEKTGLEPEEIAKIREDVENGYLKSTARRYGIPVDRLRELARADREGRVVVLPFRLHSTLFDASNEARPKLMEDFRLSATWTQCGIVFSAPWNIFLEDVDRGYINRVSEEAEAALKGEDHEADPV